MMMGRKSLQRTEVCVDSRDAQISPSLLNIN